MGRRSGRGGFTLIELLTAIVMVGILIGIALPSLTGAIARTDAVKVVTDVRTVQLAVLELEATTGSLPTPGGWGQVPAELQSLLPDGFQFSYKELEYAWSTLAQGAPGSASIPGAFERYLGYAMARAGGGGSRPSQESDAVGVLWVRYDASDPVAGALQAHTSATAVWSPTQMMFLVTR